MKLKPLFLISALFLTAAIVTAQTPQGSVNLNEMTFVRQSFVRNFYNSQKVMSQINMEGTDLFLKNSANIVVEHSAGAPKLVQDGRTLKLIFCKRRYDAS